jgi:hypothetical protein
MSEWFNQNPGLMLIMIVCLIIAAIAKGLRGNATVGRVGTITCRQCHAKALGFMHYGKIVCGTCKSPNWIAHGN